MISPNLVGVAGLAFLLTLIALGVPIGFSFLIAGTLGIIYLGGLPAAVGAIMGSSWHWGTSFVMLAVPLFILMGSFCYHGGISQDLYAVMYKLTAGVPGALGIATVGTCGAFAACSGSSLATAAAIGKVAYPEMKRFGYSPRLSLGCIAAGGTLGSLIPPSIFFIIYGMATETSIGKLFMAGVFPGIMMVLLYSLVIYILAVRYPSLAPRSPRVSWRERFGLLPRLMPTAGMAIVVLGGIYGGIFTPSEAAAAGAFTAFLYWVSVKPFSKQAFTAAMVDAGHITGMVFMVIIGAMVFNTFMALSGLSKLVSVWLVGLDVPPVFCIVLLLMLYIPMGMFMDAVGMVLLTLPFFLPVFIHAGLNLVWIGVLVIRLMEVALITPPVGLSVFVVRGIAKDIPLEEIFRGIIPFVIMDVLGMVLLVVFPQISLFLPDLMLK